MKSVIPTFTPENSFWLEGALKQSFYLYLELQGAQVPTNDKRAPLNISLVLDRSGSMHGDKIAFVKKAAQFVIDNLAAEDYLSIVQYDDEIDVVSPSARVQNKNELKRRIEQIQARNMTNLSGGMLAGFEQVQASKQPKYVSRVLLLSDGLANQGIVEPEKLREIARQKFREEGIALSTFGVGADFNEVLMTNLSEHGGANYYFIDSPDKIPSIFAQELQGLLAVVAQNARLDIRFPQDYFRCEKVYGFPADIVPGQVSVRFNDLFSDEKKAVLVKLEAQRPIDRDIELSAEFRYDNVLGNFDHVEERFSAPLKLTRQESDVLAGAQPNVSEQTALFVATEMFEEVVRLADRRDYAGAKALVGQVRAYLEKHFQTMPPNEELSRLYAQIIRYDAQIESMEHMSHSERSMSQKVYRNVAYMSMRKKDFLTD
jgi:Ca-activated chloride channel homolog